MDGLSLRKSTGGVLLCCENCFWRDVLRSADVCAVSWFVARAEIAAECVLVLTRRAHMKRNN
jgi:hypothetical protein